MTCLCLLGAVLSAEADYVRAEVQLPGVDRGPQEVTCKACGLLCVPLDECPVSCWSLWACHACGRESLIRWDAPGAWEEE